MPVPQWRQFTFFTKEEVNSNKDSKKSLEWLQTIDITAVTAGRGHIFIGGKIYIVDVVLSLVYQYQAYANPILKLKIMKKKNLLFSIAEGENNIPTLKLWNLDKRDKSNVAPALVKMLPLQHGNRIFPVTALAILESMAQLAVGFENGIVILIRGDITRDRLTKQKVILEGSEEIRGLGFHEDAGTTTLYVSTAAKILTIETSNKDIVRTLDDVGSPTNCAITTLSDIKQDLVVARDDAIYYYSPDGRGPCFISSESKIYATFYKHYLIVVSPRTITSESKLGLAFSTEALGTSSSASLLLAQGNGNRGDPGSHENGLIRTDEHLYQHKWFTITVYNLTQKFIAWKGDVEGAIKGIVSEWDEIMVFCSDGKKIIKLVELPVTSQLALLKAQHQYSIALAIANSYLSTQSSKPSTKSSIGTNVKTPRSTHSSVDEFTVYEIHLDQANYLFSQHDYTGAIQSYIKTIGYTSPGFVVRKYLDTSRVDDLIMYLMEVVSKGYGGPEVTTLLVSCWVRTRNDVAVEEYLKQRRARKLNYVNKIKSSSGEAPHQASTLSSSPHHSYSTQYSPDPDHSHRRLEKKKKYQSSISSRSSMGHQSHITMMDMEDQQTDDGTQGYNGDSDTYDDGNGDFGADLNLTHQSGFYGEDTVGDVDVDTAIKVLLEGGGRFEELALDLAEMEGRQEWGLRILSECDYDLNDGSETMTVSTSMKNVPDTESAYIMSTPRSEEMDRKKKDRGRKALHILEKMNYDEGLKALEKYGLRVARLIAPEDQSRFLDYVVQLCCVGDIAPDQFLYLFMNNGELVAKSGGNTPRGSTKSVHSDADLKTGILVVKNGKESIASNEDRKDQKSQRRDKSIGKDIDNRVDNEINNVDDHDDDGDVKDIAEEFLERVFIGRWGGFHDIPPGLLNKKWGLPKENPMRSIDDILEQKRCRLVCNTLLEIYLCTADQGKTYIIDGELKTIKPIKDSKGRMREEKALELLKDPIACYDSDHALILCKIHSFHRGLLYLYEKKELYRDIIEFHIKHTSDADVILESCRKYGKSDPDLWSLVLRHFAQLATESDTPPSPLHSPLTRFKSIDDFLTLPRPVKPTVPHSTDNSISCPNDVNNPIMNVADSSSNLYSTSYQVSPLQKLLIEIEERNVMTPLKVLSVLSGNGGVTIGMVRGYFIKKFTENEKESEEIVRLIDSYQSETKNLKEKLTNLNSEYIIFENRICSMCQAPLELPYIHYLCKHSFHERCLPNASLPQSNSNTSTFHSQSTSRIARQDHEIIEECPICAPEQHVVLDMIRKQKESISKHDLFLHQLEGSENRFAVIADYFSKNVFMKEED